MIRSSRLTTLLVFILSLAGHASFAQTGKFDLEKTKRVLTGLIETMMKERGTPSMSIALLREDRIVWKAAFGYANVRMKAPATTQTLYNTGSTLKAVTSTAIMQLVDRGAITIDDPVNRYLGKNKIQDRLQSDKAVTFRHLLSHFAGLSPGVERKPIWSRELPPSLTDIASGLYSIRPPETKWEYNNYGYALAGLLIEKISGVPYEKYIVDNIFKPVGAQIDHPVHPSPEMVERLALPYNPGGSAGQPIPMAQMNYDYFPAGDAYATPDDMIRFLGAHLNGGVFNGNRILSEASVIATHTPQFGYPYGFGWDVEKDEKGHTIIRHAGSAQGLKADMVGDVDARVGAYYMVNSGDPYYILNAAITLLRGEEYIPPAEKKAITVDPAVLRTYVGAYAYPYSAFLGAQDPVTVSLEGTRLFIRGMRIEGFGWDKDELLAETQDTFFIRGSEHGIKFVSNEAGAVTHLAFTRNGKAGGSRLKKIS